jgi:transcriptional regulator with XRE-family HTH domain
MVDEAARDADRDSVQSLLATNLRRLRIARHLSLSELARATGMSKATLSSIENGRANPTVDTLANLAGALRISLGELLQELPIPDMRVVRAASARPAPGAPSQPSDGISRRHIDEIGIGTATATQAATGITPALEVAEIEVASGQNRESPPNRPGSRAHLFILAGKLIAGPVERSTELAAGDYASFPTDVPHLYATGRHPARALLLSEHPTA